MRYCAAADQNNNLYSNMRTLIRCGKLSGQGTSDLNTNTEDSVSFDKISSIKCITKINGTDFCLGTGDTQVTSVMRECSVFHNTKKLLFLLHHVGDTLRPTNDKTLE